MIKKIRSFTLTEIMIVVVLIGVMAAFGIPSYQRMMDKADERNARLNLALIRSAVILYLDQMGDPIPNSPNLGAINTRYNLNIIDSKLNYSCSSSSGADNNICRATRPGAGGWTIHFHEDTHNPTRTLHCNGAGCPACPGSPGDCG